MLTGVDTFVITNTDHSIFEQSLYVSQIQLPPGHTDFWAFLGIRNETEARESLIDGKWEVWSFCVFAESERRQQ